MPSGQRHVQDILLRFIVDQQGILKVKKLLLDIENQAKKKASGSRVSSVGTTGASGLLTDNELKKIQIALEKGKKLSSGIKKDFADAGDRLQRAFAGSEEEYQRIRRERLVEDVTALSKTMKVPLDRAVETIIQNAGMGLEHYRTSEDLRQAIVEAHSEGGQVAAENLRDTYGKIARLGITGFTLVMTGMRLRQLGQQMVSPATGNVEYFGNTMKASARWLAATTKMEKAFREVGVILLDQLSPAMEFLADVVIKIVEFVKKNDKFFSRVYLGTAGVATGVGFGAMMIGQTLSSIAAFMALFKVSGLSDLLKGGGLKGLLAKIGTKAAPVVAPVAKFIPKALGGLFTTGGMVGGGAIVGVGIYNLIAKIFKLQSAGEIAGKTIAVLAKSIGDLKNAETGARWFMSVAKALGLIEEATEELGPGLEATQSFIEYLQAEEDAQEAFQDEMVNINRTAQRELLKLESNYQRDRAKLISDAAKETTTDTTELTTKRIDRIKELNKDLADLTEDYFRKRGELALEYNIDVQRAEEDHLRKMRYMLEEHNLRMSDLAAKRDALGMVREMRSYEMEAAQAEEEYQIESERRAEDFARRMAELEAQYQAERARRIREARIRMQEDAEEFRKKRELARVNLEEDLKELDEAHKREVEERKKQRDQDLLDASDQYNKEKEKRRAAYLDQLRMLDATLLGELEIRDAYYQEMSKRLVSWLESMTDYISDLPNYPTTQQHHYTGYADDKTYKLQRGEFVLDPGLTKVLEKAVGTSRLNRQNILSMMFPKQNGTKSVEISIKVGSTDPLSQFQQAMRVIAQEEIDEVLK